MALTARQASSAAGGPEDCAKQPCEFDFSGMGLDEVANEIEVIMATGKPPSSRDKRRLEALFKAEARLVD